jgi:uncharacterized RDD family membrane protein YckC
MSAAIVEEVAPYGRSRDDQAWARWLARLLDATLLMPVSFLLFAGLGLAVELGRLPYEFIAWNESPIATGIVDIVMSFALFALWEPLFLSNTSTTPGKWVMGVRVLRADGGQIDFFTAYRRFIWVYIIGFGLRIPLVALICMLIARAKLVGDGVTAWDQGLNLQVTHRKRHPAVWVAVIVLVFGVSLGLTILSRMPA